MSDLNPAASGKGYTTPSGIELNATYITFLRRHLPSDASLRSTARNQPIVIVVDGKAVGVLMPVRQ